MICLQICMYHFYEWKLTPSKALHDQYPKMFKIFILLKILLDFLIEFLCLFSNKDLFLKDNRHIIPPLYIDVKWNILPLVS